MKLLLKSNAFPKKLSLLDPRSDNEPLRPAASTGGISSSVSSERKTGRVSDKGTAVGADGVEEGEEEMMGMGTDSGSSLLGSCTSSTVALRAGSGGEAVMGVCGGFVAAMNEVVVMADSLNSLSCSNSIARVEFDRIEGMEDCRLSGT